MFCAAQQSGTCLTTAHARGFRHGLLHAGCAPHALQQLEQRLWLESALDAAGSGLTDTQLSEGEGGQSATGGSTGGAGGDASGTGDQRETIALWPKPLRSGWLPHSSPIEPQHWPAPPLRQQSTGFVVVRCNGGLNQQRSAVSCASSRSSCALSWHISSIMKQRCSVD